MTRGRRTQDSPGTAQMLHRNCPAAEYAAYGCSTRAPAFLARRSVFASIVNDGVCWAVARLKCCDVQRCRSLNVEVDPGGWLDGWMTVELTTSSTPTQPRSLHLARPRWMCAMRLILFLFALLGLVLADTEIANVRVPLTASLTPHSNAEMCVPPLQPPPLCLT